MAKLSTLGLDPAAMQMVERAAFDASEKFGISASSIVGSAYDIQSAIAGLSGRELARFARTAAVLGKATLAEPSVIADYLGTLYGVFGRTADKMGRTTWADLTAGMTADAVRMFKVTGPKLAAAFGQLGADATSAGVSQAEQFAVLGNLGAAMQGGQAASRFQAFLRGVGQAQQKLGLSFRDAQGQLLPIADIIDRIKTKLGPIRGPQGDIIRQAFGGDEAVSFIQFMADKTGKLRNDVASLGHTRGLKAAEDMARAATIPFDRLTNALHNVATAFSDQLLEALRTTMERMTAGLGVVRGWIDRFPYLARVVAVATVGIAALAVAFAALGLAAGVFGLISTGLGLLGGAVALPIAAMLALGVAIGWAFEHWDKLNGAIKLIAILALPLVAAFSPVLAVWVAVGAAIYLAIKYWDRLKAAILKAWDGLKPIFTAIGSVFGGSDPATLGGVPGEMGLAGGLAQRGQRAEVAPELGQAVRSMATSNDNRRSTQIGKVEINTSERVDGYWMQRQFALFP